MEGTTQIQEIVQALPAFKKGETFIENIDTLPLHVRLFNPYGDGVWLLAAHDRETNCFLAYMDFNEEQEWVLMPFEVMRFLADGTLWMDVEFKSIPFSELTLVDILL